METCINGETDFDDLILQIEDAVESVANQNPYTYLQGVSVAFVIVEQCGFYHDDCRNWKRKVLNTKTWVNFKTHFSRAFKEVRESSSTARTGRYVNICRQEVVERAEAQKTANNETQQALANFVSAASSDLITITSLTKTIADLSTELAKANIAISALTKNGKRKNNPNSTGEDRCKKNEK